MIAPKAHIILLSLLFMGTLLHAQVVDETVVNSQTFYEGTSRSTAMGNAMGALGGDFTAACINPAGLGLYRAQEFTFSTSFQHTLIRSNYYDNGSNAGKTRMSIPNIGLVFSRQLSNYNTLRFVQFGIGLTRTNDFNYNSNAYGLNPSSSMVDYYLQTVNGIDELFDPNTNVRDYLNNNYPYDLSPAWETYLFDQFTDSLGIYYNSPVPQGNIYQQDNVTSKGRTEEWTFAVSANIHEKLFIGTSLGLSHLKRISNRVYTETPGNPKDPGNGFNTWDHVEDLNDTAWGVNFKCGVIYYPAHWLRIGAAWHSRTRYSIGETWGTETSTDLTDNPGGQQYHRYSSITLYDKYDYRTPHTFIGSAAFFIGQRGVVTTDVEYLNYGFAPTFNFRLGTEWRLRQYFVRCGASYYGSPYRFGEKYGSVKKVAVGFGYAVTEVTSWDFAYELTESTTGYKPYSYYEGDQNRVDDVVQHRWRNRLMVTLKFRID